MKLPFTLALAGILAASSLLPSIASAAPGWSRDRDHDRDRDYRGRSESYERSRHHHHHSSRLVRVWVRGHYSYRWGHRHWVPGHYELQRVHW